MIKYYFVIVCLLFCTRILAQEKKALNFDVFNNWQLMENPIISDNGKWISYEIVPYRGDKVLTITSSDQKIEKKFNRGEKCFISSNSDFAVFLKKPPYDTIRKLKLKKEKPELFPKDSLQVWIMNSDKIVGFECVKSFSIAKENSSWIAFLSEKLKTDDDTLNEIRNKKNKPLKKNIPETFQFTIYNPISNIKFSLDEILSYDFSKNGKSLFFVKYSNDSVPISTIYHFDCKLLKLDSFILGKGFIKNVVASNNGTHAAWLFSTDSVKEKTFSLYLLSLNSKSIECVVDSNTCGIIRGMAPSENSTPFFSPDDNKLFFGTSYIPEKEILDTIPEDEKIKLDLWHWDEPVLQSQQINELQSELKRTFQAVFNLKNRKCNQIATPEIPTISLVQNGNLNLAFGYSSKSYEKLQQWETPAYKDVYLMNLNNGNIELLKKKHRFNATLSTNGKYFIWYESDDKNWYSLTIQNRKQVCLTKEIPVKFYNEDHDMPSVPEPYGIAGWTEDDSNVLIYDKYDIWLIDPSGQRSPKNITNSKGRAEQITFRYEKTDPEAFFIDCKKAILLNGFNQKTKETGFYSIQINSQGSFKQLVMGNCYFTFVAKARQSDQIIWRKSTVSQFPDLWVSSMEFTMSRKISALNPQQKDYNWATSELFYWTTPSGIEAEGILYKPENFKNDKKYPVIVYFYEKESDRLNMYLNQMPSRSTINPVFFASNEYIVFIPNIEYQTGYPGKSAYNYIVSGVNTLKRLPFIDSVNIGLQGQSWGGYQVSYIITQTDMFKAAGAGAPVSNMTSAYGGIRWESGASRMFQYEKGQSRLGVTLWDSLFLYIENSPIFFADKINTPLLIMSNDNDGSVPWSQGVELFVALRRLNKQAWLLNYNGEPHNLRRGSPNGKDLSIRLFQYFEHFLKGKPAPVWITKGIPAIEKGKKLGYEIEN